MRLWNYEANLFFGRNSLLSFDRNTFGLMCRCLRRHWRMKMWNCWRLMSKEARWKYCKVPGRVFSRSKGEKSICSTKILPATKTYTRMKYVVFKGFENGGWFGIQFLEGLVLRILQKFGRNSLHRKFTYQHLPVWAPSRHHKGWKPCKVGRLGCPKVSVVFFLAILFGWSMLTTKFITWCLTKHVLLLLSLLFVDDDDDDVLDPQR